jgi:colanic acid biosynthesis glycosyl transferase WcaI
VRCLIVSCVYPPEPVTSATTSAELAAELAGRGHEVIVVAPFPHHPMGRLYDGWRQHWRSAEVSGGIETIRVWSWIPRNRGLFGRFLESLSFGVTSAIQVARIRPDVVYLNTWPIVAAGCAIAAAKAVRAPIVLSVQDIHPEAGIALGKLPATGHVPGILKALDRWAAHAAACVVTISENFREFYRDARRLPENRIEIVPNWMDERAIVPMDHDPARRADLRAGPTDFVAMYVGNVGAVAGVERLVEAAHLLREHQGIVLVIAGDGSEREQCEALVARLGLSNVRFCHPVDRSDVSALQAQADALLLPTRGTGALHSVPSKLIAYMLSARPVIAGVDPGSDLARIVESAECGVCISPDSAAEVARQVVAWADQRDRLAALGENGRRYAVEHFSRQTCAPRLADIVAGVGEGANRGVRSGRETSPAAVSARGAAGD